MGEPRYFIQKENNFSCETLICASETNINQFQVLSTLNNIIINNIPVMSHLSETLEQRELCFKFVKNTK